MAEYTAIAEQTVAANQNILLTETPVCGNAPCIVHREGSGLVTLRGITKGQCRARFKVTFGGNIAIPTGGTVEAISVAIAINGEAVNSTIMIASFFIISPSRFASPTFTLPMNSAVSSRPSK